MIWSDVPVHLDLRRFLIALLLACPVVVLGSAPSHACTCKSTEVSQQVEAADAVFSGVLVDVTDRTTGKRDRKVTDYEIEADVVYKGDLTAPEVEVRSSGDTCALGKLPVQRRYLFFVSTSDSGLLTDLCSGTDRTSRQLTMQVEDILGEGTDLSPRQQPVPVVVEFTRVADAEPETLTRLAAPGAALVLLGLLGLFVVRRATRRD